MIRCFFETLVSEFVLNEFVPDQSGLIEKRGGLRKGNSRLVGYEEEEIQGDLTELLCSSKFHEEKKYEQTNDSSSLSSSFRCRHFSLAEIKSATQNFNEGLIIGRGGFGEVYKGIIENGSTTVAIKRLGFWSKQGAPEFWMEIKMLTKFRHSHLVSLIGYCDDQPEMILVYEYMPGGTLADNLHKFGTSNRPLSWVQRLRVCLGVARGLDYLHTGTSIQTRVIHRDIKSSNILLDGNWEAKVSDFGLSKVGPAAQTCTHVITHVKGTFGYLDPEYIMTHRLTRKSDVYAFGVVMFEVLCGRAAVDVRLDEEQWGLAKWVKRSIKEGRLLEIVDPRLNGSILLDCLKAFAQIAEQCLNDSSRKRPTMAEVVTRLEYALSLQEMTTFSLMDAEVISNAGDEYNQEGIDSSIEIEVRDADDGNFSTLNNNGSVGYNDEHAAIRSQSTKRAAKKVTFAKQVLLFFSTKPPTKPPAKPLAFSGDYAEVYSEFCKLKRFSLLEIKVATGNFSDKCILGGGGFGNTYKGCLVDGSLVAVKRLVERHSRARELEFQKEVEIISLAQHQNLLQLLGFCTTSTERLLVYPYMANESVASRLRALPKSPSALDWRTRKRIAVGSAKGLTCLHEDYIIHHNIGASSIFLNEFSDVVIGNFGLAQHRYQNAADFTALVHGKSAYLAPEYLSAGKFSRETDVYGYGVMLLELIIGPMYFDLPQRAVDDHVRLLNWVRSLVRERKFQSLVDKNLQGVYFEKEVERLTKVALLCTHGSPMMRPKMSEVVRMLQGDELANRWGVYQKEIFSPEF